MATVIFKATEACNARCIYCDVVHKKPRNPVTMPLETLELFFSRINEFLTEKPQEKLDLVWHGGEPLLLGPDYFSKALHFQQKHCVRTSDRIHHSIQSNVTLFSREFTPILKELGIDSIGTSYEPIPGVRGLGAKRDWREYNKRFLEGIGRLEEEGFCWGIIYVVNKLSLAKPVEIFQMLHNLAPKGAFMFNPVVLYDLKAVHLKIEPEEYADFLGAIFHLWWQNREELGNVDPFASLVSNLVDGKASLGCSDSGACADTHINLLPDGSLSHCGRSADWGLLNYGSIFDTSLSRAFADPQRDVLRRRNKVLPKTVCKGCRFWNICHGGCPLDAWSAEKTFMHKTEWCMAKKKFIEEYFEPVVKQPEGPKEPGPECRPYSPPVQTVFETSWLADGEPVWINPMGGLGDTLMFSGVLKLLTDKYPNRKFNLVDRTKYREFLEGHPAIDRIGHPPPGARIVHTSYWEHEIFFSRGQRAFQTLARIFGLETPVQERLYVPWDIEQGDPEIERIVPWKKRNVLISQSSDSFRKRMDVAKWESVVDLLKRQGIGVVQAGRMGDQYVRGAYSLIGLTSARSIIRLLRRFDAIVTVDSFMMHAAHLCSVPAVVLWGPTDHLVYGYPGQVHLRAKPTCENPENCIGPGQSRMYRLDCPEGEARCMNAFNPEDITREVFTLLTKKLKRRANQPQNGR